MTTSRRKFIKISALGLGGVAASTTAFNMFGANSYLDELVKENVAKNLKEPPLIAKFVFGSVLPGRIQMKTEKLKNYW